MKSSDTSENCRVVDRLELETELLRAIACGQIALHYQPIVDIRTGRIAQMEALVRWEHPRLGTISPSRFIPIAEDTGLIHSIGEWVLDQACRQLKTWQAKFPHYASLGVSVNMSHSQLRQDEFVSRVRRTLDAHDLPAGSLTLEITESLIAAGTDQVVFWMKALRAAGAKIAIGNFGKGYSSTHYLARMPVDILKIDREFISRMNSFLYDDAVTRSAIQLGHDLNLKVTGEGVETIEQLGNLRDHGCDYAQGYIFAVPGPAERIDPLLSHPVCIARYSGIASHLAEGA